MTDFEANLFDAASCEGVVAGHCVFLKQDSESAEFEVVYAGPCSSAPDCSGVLMFLNPADFDRLKTITEKKRH